MARVGGPFTVSHKIYVLQGISDIWLRMNTLESRILSQEICVEVKYQGVEAMDEEESSLGKKYNTL